MKASLKISLITLALGLLACVIVLMLVSRPEEPIAESAMDTSQGPAFEVRVVVPRLARPFGGILPDWVVKNFDGTPSELRFDHTSGGVRIGRVAPDHLELRADGWELFIESDGDGRIAPGTHLVFPLALGGRQVRLDCRPAEGAGGYLHTNTRAGSDELGGRFLVKLSTCKNAESGKATAWPPAALTVRGSFAGLPPSRR